MSPSSLVLVAHKFQANIYQTLRESNEHINVFRVYIGNGLRCRMVKGTSIVIPKAFDNQNGISDFRSHFLNHLKFL
jgi:hypothetical protein